MSMNYKAFFIDPITPLSIKPMDTFHSQLRQVETSQISSHSEAYEHGAYSEWRFNCRAASKHKKGEKSLELWKRYLNLV